MADKPLATSFAYPRIRIYILRPYYARQAVYSFIDELFLAVEKRGPMLAAPFPLRGEEFRVPVGSGYLSFNKLSANK